MDDTHAIEVHVIENFICAVVHLTLSRCECTVSVICKQRCFFLAITTSGELCGDLQL